MDEIEFLVEDDGDGATKLLNKIVEADLSTLSEERLIKAIKDQTKIALGALRKAAKVAREPADKPTHANYALALLKELKAQGDVPAVGVEGKLWKYAPDRGVWVGRLTSDYEVEVAQHFDGKENCNRRSDYVAIATHAYAIASEDEEDFFNDAPIGLACEKRFYRVTDENEIVRDKLSADHRQRVLSPVRPITGDMPIFRAFMADTFRGDGNTEQIDLLQEVMGAVALGTMARHEKVLLLKGPGRSGKSTIAKIIEHLVPSDARSAVSPFKWDSEYYLANMAGKRLNVVGELPDDEAIPASHFKSVTGRDMLTGRHPTHRPFNFRNTAAHIFNANHYVFTKDHSEAFYARWILMDFRNSRLGTDETINVNLAEQIIRDELPAIMAWALQGAKRLQERGNFPTTKAHNRLMDQWRRRTSTLMEFLQDDDECLLGKGDQFSVRRSNFYEAYSRWCRDSNRRPLGKQRLYDEIETPQVAALGVKFSKLAGNSVLLRGVLIKTVDFLAAYKQADSDEL
jgi:putative DNA primase/helicase